MQTSPINFETNSLVWKVIFDNSGVSGIFSGSRHSRHTDRAGTIVFSRHARALTRAQLRKFSAHRNPCSSRERVSQHNSGVPPTEFSVFPFHTPCSAHAMLCSLAFLFRSLSSAFCFLSSFFACYISILWFLSYPF